MSLRAAILLPLLLVACNPPAKSGASAGTGTSGTVALPSAPAAQKLDSSTVVAHWNGGQMTWGEVETKLKGRLMKMEIDYLTERYNVINQTVEGSITENLITAEAKKRGLADADALIKAEIEDKFTSATDAEIQAYFTANQKRFRGKPLEEVKDQVTKALLDEKKRAAYMALIDSMKTQANLTIELAAPDLPRLDVATGDGPIRGNKDAKVTIVEFADYQCPFCSRGFDTMVKLQEQYQGKVKWVYRDLPLAMHKQAIPAAVAVRCAGKQNKFWEMHDLLFKNQQAMTETDWEAHATSLGLDIPAYKTCLTDTAVRDAVQADMAYGQELGLSGAPAYFVNGIMLSGAQPIDAFKKIIDQELKAKAN